MRIYFVRHGESEANLLWEFSNGLGKHPLTELGVSQAHALAATFDQETTWKIYASPILRAQQTASVVADRLGCTVETAEPLREYSVGVFEGRSDKAAWDVYWQVAEAWELRQEYDARIEGGESFNDIRARFVPFVQQLLNGKDDDMICVGHGGTFHLMLPLVLDNIDLDYSREHRMGHTTVIAAEKVGTKLIARHWGDDILS